jgi:hypothetical protein
MVLGKTGGKRRRAASSTKAANRRQPDDSEPPGVGDRDEAAKFIAEAVGNLAEVAQSHGLDHLRYLLAVARMEAEEHMRLRSKRRLS